MAAKRELTDYRRQAERSALERLLTSNTNDEEGQDGGASGTTTMRRDVAQSTMHKTQPDTVSDRAKADRAAREETARIVDELAEIRRQDESKGFVNKLRSLMGLSR